jgi:hypothetical protein
MLVIPAKAGIQISQVIGELDPGFRRDDGLVRGFLSHGPKNEGRHDTAASA